MIEAIAAGKRAAESIERYLKGQNLKENRKFKISEEEIATYRFKGEEIAKQEATPVRYADPKERSNDFHEVVKGYSYEEARREAERCLNCGVCSECLECVKVCKAGAINHQMTEKELELEVGALILCPGFEKFDASELGYYGYGKYPNVLTSLEFERVLSASGPYQGHLVRPYDHREPKKIAWIQCVGSRNYRINHEYCSSVCCMYAIKEAIIAKEHSKEELDTAIFYMDMRTYGKGFEKYYERALSEHKVRFIRSRIYALEEVDNESKNLRIRYVDEDGSLHSEEFDLVVLSVGMKTSPKVIELGRKLGLELNQFGFAEPYPLTGVGTNRPGIFVAGAFSGPKDIPETVMQASAAAGAAESLLAEARGTLVSEKVYPPERDVTGEEPRIGVFICHCGINIGGVVNVPAVVNAAKELPHVIYAEDNLYTCSQDTQARIKEKIKELKLNRVVVASCSPRTHRPLFQETIREAGLNGSLFEMANIRDQCSWVHMFEPEKATIKAIELVKMAVSKAALLAPVKQVNVGVTKSALVIGGGVAGITASLELAEQGYDVHLVEKSSELGGIARRIKKGFKNENVQAVLDDLIRQVRVNPRVKLYMGTEVKETSGYLGNFVTTLTTGEEIAHGVTIVATGGQEYKPQEYLYGHDKRVLTQLEFDEALYASDPRITNAKNIVLIQCVGSREQERNYCSRVCCTRSVKIALEVKEVNPEA
ncbi:MAG: FAD-dependent oxidoreductase, partial [Desulfofundulus sp.]